MNTGRLHNEILKHRLSSIPVYVKENNIMSQSVMEKFCQENILEIDCHNDSDVSREQLINIYLIPYYAGAHMNINYLNL